MECFCCHKVYKIEDLQPGHEVPGPSIIVQPISTVILEVNCSAQVTSNGDLKIKVLNGADADRSDETPGEIRVDPVKLSIFSHRFMGIAEQM